MMRIAIGIALGIALGVAALAAAGQEAETAIGVGAVYTTGRYGESQTTNMFVVPLTLKHETPSWIFRGLASYMRITGPSNVVALGDGAVALPGDRARRTNSGFGDVVASAMYKVLKGASGLDIGAKVKFATADDDKALGTGKNDYAVQMDGYAPLGSATMFGTLGYRWYLVRRRL